MIKAWLFSAALLWPLVGGLHSYAMAADTTPPSSATLVVVVGAAGTDDYGRQFAAWTSQWEQVATQSGATLQMIGRDTASSMTDHQRLQTAIATAADDDSSTPLWIVMIGHGTFAGDVAKFNLQGPDVTASELAEWLQPLQRPVVVVNCASSSGPFINRLSASNRVIVTATKSGNEQNFARFGKFFAGAIADIDSDLDHDGEISVQEAFLRASREVDQFYESQGRIVTEHALLDDNGDGKGTPASLYRGTRPSGTVQGDAAIDGAAAKRITMAPAGQQVILNEAQRQRRDAIEQQLEQLRSRQDQLSETEYDLALEPLLLELARLYEEASG